MVKILLLLRSAISALLMKEASINGHTRVRDISLVLSGGITIPELVDTDKIVFYS